MAMKIDRAVFLGTGDAFSAGGRYQASYMLQGAGRSILLDCGPATLSCLKRQELAASQIDTILLSHFHGDHFAGLPFLFMEYVYVEPRKNPLRIVGPPGVERMIMSLFQTLFADCVPQSLPFEIQFSEAQPGNDLVFDGWKIRSFFVPHQKNPPSYGYEIRSGELKIVYSGDTGWTEELLTHSENANLFICECSFFETRLDIHLDYPRIAENFRRFGSKRIVLTHLGQEVLRRRHEIELEVAHDGLIIDL